MRGALFTSGFVNLMGETGFRLFPKGQDSYVIQNYDTVYAVQKVSNGWLLDQLERGEQVKTQLEFRDVANLERFLSTELREFQNRRHQLFS